MGVARGHAGVLAGISCHGVQVHHGAKRHGQEQYLHTV